jgi:hypothetical protein
MFQILRRGKGRKATGYDGAPGKLPKLLGQDGFKLMAQMINNMYDTNSSYNDCRSPKLQNAATIAQSAKIVVEPEKKHWKKN